MIQIKKKSKTENERKVMQSKSTNTTTTTTTVEIFNFNKSNNMELFFKTIIEKLIETRKFLLQASNENIEKANKKMLLSKILEILFEFVSYHGAAQLIFRYQPKITKSNFIQFLFTDILPFDFVNHKTKPSEENLLCKKLFNGICKKKNGRKAIVNEISTFFERRNLKKKEFSFVSI